MYRAMGQVQACPPEARRPPQKDPCAVKYVVDLPVLGEEEIEVPVEKLSSDFMASVTRQLPRHLPQIFADLQPYVDRIEGEAIDEAEELIQRTLDRKLRPEIEAQKVQLLADVREEVNKALVVMGIIGITIVGGVGLAAWYTKRRVS